MKIYEIKIRCMDSKYYIDCDKNIGDNSNSGGPINTKEEAIRHLRHVIEGWRSFDSILERQVEPPSKKNTVVKIEGNLIREEDIWAVIIQEGRGSRSLESYFGDYA